MEDRCHRAVTKGHTGNLKQRFSKAQVGSWQEPRTLPGQVGVACAGGAAGVVGLSLAAALVPAETVLLGLPMVVGPGALMSGHRWMVVMVTMSCRRFFNTNSTSKAPCGLKITVRVVW